MFECGRGLRTWAVCRIPAVGDNVDAQSLPDHRRFYLDYEGPISGDRGIVRRYDAGEFDCEVETATEFCVAMRGKKVVGRIRFRAAEAGIQCWTLSMLAD
jgi:hypothetical protein